MIAFVFKLILAAALFVGVKVLNSKKASTGRDGAWIPPVAWALRALAVLLVIWAVAGTSYVWVKSGNIATLKRELFGKALPPGKIVATEGEMGPQAKILTAGLHIKPLITLIYDVEIEPVFIVPPGQCAVLSAKDGENVPSGGAFAEPWTDATAKDMANDAEFFLKNHGQRGPQSTVLRPGNYTLNPYLWEKPRLIPATRVEQGTVGVIKSSVHAAVDFGDFRRPKPTNTAPVLLKNRLPEGAASVNIVAVGGIGVWEEPLLPNLYYINTEAYKITHVPVAALVFEYKGGYTRRTIELTVDDKTGAITSKETVKEVQPVPEAADTAIFVKPEGWDVPQELRVLAQISPADAPLIVSALALTEQNAVRVIDDRVVTPVMRSVVRDVLGGKPIKIVSQSVVTDTNGMPKLVNGEPQTVTSTEFRPVKVLDLLENRASLEAAIEQLVKPEAQKEYVTILEVRLAESATPPELLVPRKREQLAQQTLKAWKQEELAQVQRQSTENQRAQADQQNELVKAEMQKKAAQLIAEATKIKAEGEKAALLSMAEGQKAQKEVLGDEATVRLRMFDQALKALTDLADKNPAILTTAMANASKLVPEVVVNNNGGGGGNLEGAMAVLGKFIGGTSVAKPVPHKVVDVPAPAAAK